MNKPYTSKKLLAVASLSTSMLCLAAQGQTVVDSGNPFSTTLGTDNDGLGGFTISTTGADDSWNTTTSAVVHTNTGGATNNSLLQDFSFDTSVGTAYQIIGTLTWTAEADRNNRNGIYLFGNQADLGVAPGENELGALSFLWNSDDQDILHAEGIDVPGSIVTQGISNPDVPATNTVYTEQVTFQADFEYLAGDLIQLDLSFFNNFGGNPGFDMMTQFTLDSTVYTGGYFGFAGRTRDDGASNSIGNYEQFSFTQTAVPEPSAFGLITAGMAGMMLLRRRRS